ncbi:MAG: TlyA family RNA methyltransferase [Gloeomargarita sp. SKYBB_i_bin120]|nr:TlyA family RNA methyltransferase [Gloeomargarita sp. SKYB120]MDW8178489.1 TlyA family RNA methyltransferase [Gloeomargarita sp. SKYBB_i_bin120]
MKERLDTLLVTQGHFPTREQARRAIQAGWVQVNRQVVDKPGALVPADSAITIQSRAPYVSRGGEKLAHALCTFGIAVAGRVALDGGISTGGFTDCLLQAGARRVYGVDVGYGQVAWQLRQDPRLKLLERTNLRYLQPEQIYGPDDPWPDLGVLDLSFISVTKVLPAVWHLLLPPRELVVLVKPQFEVGREQVGKGGVVRSPQAQAQAIQSVAQAATTLGWHVQGLTASPLLGPAGNREFLLWLRMTHPSGQLDWPALLAQVVTDHDPTTGFGN